MFEYSNCVLAHLERVADTQRTALEAAARQVARTIVEDRIIHTFGTGHSHMIGVEMFTRAGGLGNVNAMLDSTVTAIEGARRSAAAERISGMAELIWDEHVMAPEDLMIIISNSGRNAMPIEMAMKARSYGLFTIAVTSMQHSLLYESRHSSGRKLYELADLVIDNCVPPGDVSMQVGSIRTGPLTSVTGMFIVNILLTEGLKLAHAQGADLPVYRSQNTDETENEILFERYKGRVKHI